jgi:hypothetical protein
MLGGAGDPGALLRLIEICVAEIENGRTPGKDWLKRVLRWGLFPTRLRLLYIAQRGRCSLCGELILPDMQREDAAAGSEDHVVPRFLEGRGIERNKLLAHRGCNTDRGYATPSAELLAETIRARLKRYQGALNAASARRVYQPTEACSTRSENA